MDKKGASLDKKKVRNWAPKFLEKKGAKLDKKGAKSETSQLLASLFCGCLLCSIVLISIPIAKK